MKKIIPFFTKIYQVVLYIDKDSKPSIAYSAYDIFNKDKKDKDQEFENMPKLHFVDIDSANRYLAKRIYPNIVWDATVQNATSRGDAEEEAEFAKTGFSTGGSGNQFYFAGTENLKECYFDFYMAAEKKARRKILNHKSRQK